MICAVEAGDLRKRYRGASTNALDAISFRIARGEIIGLLGPNGAGKTTLTKLLCGVMSRTSGSLTVLGSDPDIDGVRLKRSVGVVHQRPTFDMFLSATDNLAIFAAFNGLRWSDAKRSADQLLEAFQLGAKRSRPVFTLSGGEQRRLQVVRALLKKPALLLLDEPSAGLDVTSRRAVWAIVGSLRQDIGSTIIWTSHYVEELERNCDRVLVLDRGAILRFDTPAALVHEFGRERLVIAFSRPIDLTRCERVLRDANVTFSLDANRIEAVGASVRDRVPALLSVLGTDSAAISELKISSQTLEDAFLAVLDRDLGDRARATSSAA